jgi:hypothetical protein
LADNRDLASLSGNCAADEVTYSGDTAVVQVVRLAHVSGSEGSKTLAEIAGTAGSPGTAALTIQGIASGTVVPVGDGSGTLTVDAPVGTPVFVRLSDGSAAITTLPVSLASVPSHAVTNAGTFAVQNTRAGATTATLANVAGSASSVTLQASNSGRLRLVIVNDSESILRVKYGSTASATSFTYQLAPFATLTEEMYTGIVTGIWDSATGSARMTELTA